MSSPTTNEGETPNESREEDAKDEIVNVPNLNVMDKTVVSFDETLPPGVAPEGFMLVDEDSDSSRVQTCQNKDSVQDSDRADSPIFTITFKNDAYREKYGSKIERYAKDLITSRSRRRTAKSVRKELVLEIYEHTDSQKYSSDSPESKGKLNNDSFFSIDNDPKLQDDLDVPLYGKKFQKTLQKEDDEAQNDKESSAPKMTCFNCLGNHSLRDCDQPRNFAAINKNRKEYNAKRGPMNARYHTDDDQRFGHFAAGQVSSNLRDALGLRDDELPRHIYRMRMLGYPPGWLEEARLQHSGLALFNSEGIVEKDDGEEGEIFLPGDKDKYDTKKIIDFPGFNIYPPEGTLEEYENYWGSAQQEYFSKDAMLNFLSTKQVDAGYKRKKLPNQAQGRVSGSNLNPGEMDVDETEETSIECLPVQDSFVPPLPQEEDTAPPPPPVPEHSDSPAQGHSNDGSTSRDDSPSLVDLENAKKQLLAELNETSSQSNSDSGKAEDLKLKSSKMEGVDSDSPKPDSENYHANNVTPKSNSKTHKQVIDMHLGTPILKSASPFKRLPASEKFSKDICDVINFENLPDSTGKYEQMTELLQKVRTKVAELHKE